MYIQAASVTPAALFAEIVELKKKINKLESDFKSKSDELTLLRNFRKFVTTYVVCCWYTICTLLL